MLRIFVCGVMVLFLAGCASTPEYQPLHASTSQILLLNESSLKNVSEGMTLADVHKAMGQEIVIGYSATPSPSTDYKPLTIPNPYKVEELTTTAGNYQVEYYITSIHQSDGVVSDNELIPMVFKDGRLVGRGWPYLNSLRPQT
jgi:hypothetical protein